MFLSSGYHILLLLKEKKAHFYTDKKYTSLEKI